MYQVDYSKKQNKSGGARTLSPKYIGKNNKSGWEIQGKIQEDYFTWVNNFHAKHKKYGYVSGDFEGIIKASSKNALAHFLNHHPFEEWDYSDI